MIQTLKGSSAHCLLALASERYTIYFDIERKPGHVSIKQLYRRYAYIAFRENLHISTKVQLILNKS